MAGKATEEELGGEGREGERGGGRGGGRERKGEGGKICLQLEMFYRLFQWRSSSYWRQHSSRTG